MNAPGTAVASSPQMEALCLSFEAPGMLRCPHYLSFVTTATSGQRTSAHAERRIAIGHEQEGIRLHPERPSADAHHELEQSSRVAAGQQDAEPRDHDGEDGDDGQ